ncbi:DUF4157 domain-containing protein [Kitasatospora viridis]|uniref:Uncharacterized protein DUF4157 n=1 Tax=Kitasatospora viridis TaxID=281105 RepID=A0A561SAD4_9ACTN|nr:DUF4157 domain-containing protein [Kitasatospora viridis]TWF71831.1 uncharacterized protein DUF4157 [Kitasatospora viridis]
MRAQDRTVASDAAGKGRGSAANRKPAGGAAVRPGGRPLTPADVLALQRSAGNAAVLQLLARDQEQEPGHAHTGHAAEDAHAAGPGPAAAVHGVLRSSGSPLPEATRTDMEARLGADFSDVRLHTGAEARASAAELGARAYTSGNHVVIGAGGADKHTLAHELTHVIQQSQGPVAGTDNGSGLSVSDPADRFERAAEANATRAMSAPAPVQRADLEQDFAHSPAGAGTAVQSAAAPSIQRSPHGAIGGVLKLGEAAVSGIGEIKGLVTAGGDLHDAHKANAQGNATGSALGAYNNKVAGTNVGHSALGVADTAIHATEGGMQIANAAEGGTAGTLSLVAGGISLPSGLISLARAMRKGWKADKRRRALRAITTYEAEGQEPGPIADAGADLEAHLKELQEGYQELRNLELSLAVTTRLIGASEEAGAEASKSVRARMSEVAQAIAATLQEIEANTRVTGLATLEVIRQYAEMKTQRRIAYRAADVLSSSVGIAGGAVGVAVTVGAAAATAGIAVGVAGGVVGAVVAGYASKRTLGKRWKATAADDKSGPRHLWDTVAVWKKIESEREVKSGQLFDYARSSDPDVREFALTISDALGVSRDVMQPDNANPTEDVRKAAVKLLSKKLKSK